MGVKIKFSLARLNLLNLPSCRFATAVTKANIDEMKPSWIIWLITLRQFYNVLSFKGNLNVNQKLILGKASFCFDFFFDSHLTQATFD